MPLRRRTAALALLAAAPVLHAGPACLSPPQDAATSAAARSELTVAAVPLNQEDAAQRSIGRFIYAGGLEILAPASVRFGGLSDLIVRSDGSLLSVSDEGEIFEARLRLDGGGRLTGLDRIQTRPLPGADGQPMRDKSEADAEGLAELPNGDRLVSFERQHRIWRYPADGAAPVPAPAPPGTAALPLNSGLEALTAFPDGSYLAGSEDGRVWACALTTPCRETPLGLHVPEGFGLSAAAVSPDGATIGLVARVFSPDVGVRVVIRLLPRSALEDAAARPLDELVLDRPITRDNVEGLAMLRGPGGGLRLYLLSDNNFSAAQHTFLLAFDWVQR